MSGGSSHRTLGVGASALLLVLAGVGCSKDAEEATPSRECAVVSADELSDITGTDMELLKAQKGSTICRYVTKDGSVEVQLAVEGPVEKGLPKLLLTDPDRVKGVGDEAWVARKDTPLDTRLLARDGGAMLSVDLAAPKLSSRARAALATDIAEAGIDQLPKMKVKAPTGPRGDDACERYGDDQVAVLLGGVPAITPTTPPGSCQLAVEEQNLTVQVSLLMEAGATQEHLDSLTAAAQDRAATEVDDDPAYWIPAPSSAAAGGQLDVLDDGRILQVAVIGEGFAPGEAQALASDLAEIAIA